MGKIPKELRVIIAKNIRDLRHKKFQGRGGGKQCAEAFGEHVGRPVSPQQWSPWERGMRTPDELRMEQIAEFFGVTVAYLREDHSKPKPAETPSGQLPPPNASGFLPPAGMPSNTGSDFYWLFAKFLGDISGNGLRVRMATEDMDYMCQRMAEALVAHGVMITQRK